MSNEVTLILFILMLVAILFWAAYNGVENSGAKKQVCLPKPISIRRLCRMHAGSLKLGQIALLDSVNCDLCPKINH